MTTSDSVARVFVGPGHLLEKFRHDHPPAWLATRRREMRHVSDGSKPALDAFQNTHSRDLPFSIHETEHWQLQEWEDFYNFNRPHGGLNGQTPYERLRQKTTASA